MQPSIEMKNAGRKELSACALTVAEKYTNGLQVHQQPTALSLAWRGLIKELRSCCPGFTEIEYGIALNRAFIGSHDPIPLLDPNDQDTCHA